jgi:hypothetical protein
LGLFIILLAEDFALLLAHHLTIKYFSKEQPAFFGNHYFLVASE